MKREKFATVNIEGEDNIGVINLGDLTDVHKDDMRAYFTKNVEPALVKALQSHFDCPVRISVPMLELKRVHPLTVEYHVVIETTEEDRCVLVTLNETWLYSA